MRGWCEHTKWCCEGGPEVFAIPRAQIASCDRLQLPGGGQTVPFSGYRATRILSELIGASVDHNEPASISVEPFEKDRVDELVAEPIAADYEDASVASQVLAEGVEQVREYPLDVVEDLRMGPHEDQWSVDATKP